MSQEWCFENNIAKDNCDHCTDESEALRKAQIKADRKARIAEAKNPYRGMNRRDRRRAQSLDRKKR